MSAPQTKKHPSKKARKVKSASGLEARLTAWNEFLESRKNAAVIFLFLLSLALSMTYFFQAVNSPVMNMHKWDNSDMHFFDAWAKKITSGDWWGQEALHPFHDWHGDFAVEYFRQFPEAAAQYSYVADDPAQAETAKRSLMNDIYKGKTFHQEPLYTYMIALVYSIFGPHPKWVFFLQILLGAFTTVFVFLTSRHFFGSLTGFVAALFVTLCGSVMVYEMTLLRTTMTNFLMVLVVYLMLRAMTKQHWKEYALFGFGSGLAFLGQSFLVLFIVPAVIWMYWIKRKDPKTIIHASAWSGAFILILLPLLIRNSTVGVPLFSTASNAAITYIPSNVQQAYPMESFYVHMPTLVEIYHDTNGKIIPAIVESLKTFDSLGSFWRVYKDKIGGMFMWYEIPNNMNYYLYREIAPVLKILPVRYLFIAPLGLAGLLIGIWRYRWKIFPLLLMTLVTIAPLIIAGNMARYRTPLVIMLCIFAAYFLYEMISWAAAKNWKLFFGSVGLALLAFLFTSSREDPHQFVYYGFDFDTFYRHHYLEPLTKFEAEGNYEAYYQLTSKMVKNIPKYFHKVPLEQKIFKANEAESCRYVANFMESHLNILKYLNKNQEAAYYQERVNTLRARVEDFNRRAGTG